MLECFELKGMVAVVTGASRGLGRAICIALAQAGSDIVGCARDMDSLSQTMDEVKKLGRRSLGLRADVTSSHDVKIMVQRAIAECGKIDVLVNNAGIVLFKPLVEQSEEEWTNVINTNLIGTFYCCKEVGKHMIKRKVGKVINMSSILGAIGLPLQLAYASSKGGVDQMTKVMALEWAKKGVRVNAIGPTYFETDLVKQILKDRERFDFINERTPMGRWGYLPELEGIIIFLASPASDFITGQTIYVDGGWTIW